jgi:anti-anti-sigma regulatory factor
MITRTKINFHYEENGGVGIFSLSGELTVNYEDDLKIVLMRALYGTERAVVNFKDVSKIDHSCIKLVKKAYCTSLRLRNPIIITGVPQEHIDRVFDCEDTKGRSFQLATDRALNFKRKELKSY